MYYSIIFLSCVFLFLIGVIWVNCYTPRIPSMEYRIRKNKKDFFVNLFGMWIFLITTGLLERNLVNNIYIHTSFICFISKFSSWCICYGLLKYGINRVYHPAPMIVPSILNILASISQENALLTMEFPLFALFKSFRIFTVSLLMQYNWKIKLLSFFLSLTCGHFLYTYEFNRTQSNTITNYGVMWIMIFIFTDSFTSVSQENLFTRFKLTTIQMMYYINLFVVLILLPHVIYYKLWYIEQFNYSAFINLFLISISTICAQFFTIRMIYQFGSLIYIMSTTIRTICFIVLFRLGMRHEIGIYEIIELVVISVLICIYMFINKKECRNQHIQTMNLNPLNQLPIQRQLVISALNQEEKDGLLHRKSMSI